MKLIIIGFPVGISRVFIFSSDILKRYLLENLDINRQNLSIMAFLKAWSDITYSEHESPDIKNDKIFNQSQRLITLINKNMNN